jgi:hypothetical protein
MTAADNSYYPKTTTVEGKTVAGGAPEPSRPVRMPTPGLTIKRLRETLARVPSITECVRLATIAYPDFSESRHGRPSTTS